MTDFFKMLFTHGDENKAERFINALQSSHDAIDIDNTMFGQLLKAGNYKNYENNYDTYDHSILQNGDDIHQDVMNFITNTGLYHGEMNIRMNRNSDECKKFIETLINNDGEMKYSDFINEVVIIVSPSGEKIHPGDIDTLKYYLYSETDTCPKIAIEMSSLFPKIKTVRSDGQQKRYWIIDGDRNLVSGNIKTDDDNLLSDTYKIALNSKYTGDIVGEDVSNVKIYEELLEKIGNGINNLGNAKKEYSNEMSLYDIDVSSDILF